MADQDVEEAARLERHNQAIPLEHQIGSQVIGQQVRRDAAVVADLLEVTRPGETRLVAELFALGASAALEGGGRFVTAHVRVCHQPAHGVYMFRIGW